MDEHQIVLMVQRQRAALIAERDALREQVAALAAERDAANAELLLVMEQRDKFSDEYKRLLAENEKLRYLLTVANVTGREALAKAERYTSEDAAEAGATEQEVPIYNDLLGAAMAADGYIHAAAQERPMTDAERSLCNLLVAAIGPALVATGEG